MRYRKLTVSGDYTFGQGNNDYYINDSQAVAQAIKTRLKLLQGEWFLDDTDGTPYSTKILGVNTAPTRDQAIRNRILKTPGVKAITSYASQSIDRRLSVQATVDTIYGATPVEVAFP